MDSNPLDFIRSKNYTSLLIAAVIISVPIALFAYFFLYLTSTIQNWVYTTIPSNFSSADMKLWWPIIPLTLAGLIVGISVKYLPGKGGEVPIEGLSKGGGPPKPVALISIFLAAVASIGLGAVVGPEAPLIALGGGLAYLIVHLVKKNINGKAANMIAASGSFASIAALLGSPLTGAFLMMEAVGFGGVMMDLVLLPGMLAAGIGYLVFVGMDSLTGFGTFSLAIDHIPAYTNPTGYEFIWAVGFGIVAPLFAILIRKFAQSFRPHLEKHVVSGTTIIGIIIALLAVVFVKITGESNSLILFSGQTELSHLLSSGAELSIGTLLLVLLFKGVAYSLSLIGFRGGPTFPAMFLGAIAGILMSNFASLPLIAGVAIGIGAMTVSMLKLPLTSILLATLLLAADGLALMPLVIVAVVVAYVVTIRLTPPTELKKAKK